MRQPAAPDSAAVMTPEEIERLFTRSDGSYVFARWGRPLAPVAFGLADETLPVMKGAIEPVASLAGHEIAETDPELGANLMVFFVRDWEELARVPGLDRLIEGLVPLVARLEAAGANQYRVFRFDPEGAILAAFVLVRMDDELSALPAATLALNQAVQTILLWSDTAFRDRSPLALAGEHTVVRPEIGGVIRAAYDPLMPAAARDPAHALRLFARLTRPA